MTVYGYARVSTDDQDEAPQVAALVAAGVDPGNVTTERASGARTDRPALAGLLARLEPGDVLTVWKLDRLGRSLSHLVGVVDELGSRGVQFRSLTEGMDTTTAAGRLVFQVVGAMAEFEREQTRERTRLAMAKRRASGAVMGRPSEVKPRQVGLIRKMHEQGQSQSAIAESTGLSRSAVGRVLRGEIASLAHVVVPADVDALDLAWEPKKPSKAPAGEGR